jgi:hypothetical protein
VNLVVFSAVDSIGLKQMIFHFIFFRFYFGIISILGINSNLKRLGYDFFIYSSPWFHYPFELSPDLRRLGITADCEFGLIVQHPIVVQFIYSAFKRLIPLTSAGGYKIIFYSKLAYRFKLLE